MPTSVLTATLLVVAFASVGLGADEPGWYGMEQTEAAAPRVGAAKIVNRNIMTVAFSERFVNDFLQRYVDDDTPLRRLSVTFVPARDAVELTGTVALSDDVVERNHLPPAIATFNFRSTIKIWVTEKGHLAFTFPQADTVVWPGNVKAPTAAHSVRLPVEFLSVALANVRSYLSALSGDFEPLRRGEKALQDDIAERRRRLAGAAADERAAAELDLRAAELRLEQATLKRRRLELSAQRREKLVNFLAEREYDLGEHVTANHGTLLIGLQLDAMFPFLEGVRMGTIFVDDGGNGERYLTISVNAAVSS